MHCFQKNMEMKMESPVCFCEHGGAEKKKGQNTSPVTVVLKVDFHCDGCIAKIVGLARRLEGVETVRADPLSSKLTLIGFIDPVKVAENLQKESKKKIELISPKAKKEPKGNDDTKADHITNTTVAVTTVMLKLNCACDGCIKKIHKTVSKTKGVFQVHLDKNKEVATVMGTMEVNSLTDNIQRKLNKSLHILPEKKEKKKDTTTEVGSGLPYYGCHYGPGPYGFMEGPFTGFFSEEDQSGCSVM
ncbi:unnamed protein product [Thlaspi arvense]|uniref:HMA domain-containing protein n=1 Tax=Thlaspi arvense TaxID=13288 RepID=A0AAU9S8V5_THLAR|nr:unnamed protein product [Thlaspi arvense]